MVKGKRSIFKIFWKTHCCIKLLFIKLDNSSFGHLLVSYFGKSAKFEPDWPNFKFNFFKMSNIEFVPFCSIMKNLVMYFPEDIKKTALTHMIYQVTMPLHQNMYIQYKHQY